MWRGINVSRWNPQPIGMIAPGSFLLGCEIWFMICSLSGNLHICLIWEKLLVNSYMYLGHSEFNLAVFFWNLKVHLQWHNSFKITPPNLSQIDQVFKYMNLQGPFSFKPPQLLRQNPEMNSLSEGLILVSGHSIQDCLAPLLWTCERQNIMAGTCDRESYLPPLSLTA